MLLAARHVLERDQAFGDLWSPGVKTMDFEGFRIVAVDDSRKTVSSADLEALRALCAEGTPIIILCHVPIATPYCRHLCQEKMTGKNDYFYLDSETEDENGRAFVELCVNNSAIRAVVCGHVHGYYEMEFAPGKPQIIGSQGMAGAVDIITVTG